MADLSTTLQSSLATLSSRERRMVLAAGGAVLVFVVFMVTFSFSNKATKIRTNTEAKIVKLGRIQELAASYNQSRAQRDLAERQLAASNIRLSSYLEDIAKQKGVELPTINPKADVTLDGTKIVESSVEVTLTDVKLNRLLEFLQAVEGGPGVVKVKYMRLEPRPSSESITAWLQVATYHLKN
ncbi:MAG: type II secretion system protein M [Myxococcaceae bacterium]|jgi:general secretion pathway protein M|nr:type II secretion system protein M [Myxococcaceae bacterium]